MLVGENLVGAASFVSGTNTVLRAFRCTIARTAPGILSVVCDDDTTEADTEVTVSSTPNGNVSAALVPFVSWRRTGIGTFEISTSVAVAVAADTANNTIIRFSLRRIDTV